MMTWSRIVWVMGACLLASPTVTTAQDKTSAAESAKFEIFAEFGGSFFTQKSDIVLFAVGNPPMPTPLLLSSSVRTTGRLFGGFRYRITPADGFEASYSYSPSDVTVRFSALLKDEVALVRADFFSFNYVRSFATKTRIKPFLTAGIGLVYWHGLRPEFNKGFTGNFGGGIDFDLSQRWAIRAEYRDFLLQHPRIGVNFPTGMSHNQVPSVGVVFRF